MSRPTARRAIMLWSGGKDSALALHRARQQDIDVVSLITFGSGAEFRCHPQLVLSRQAECLHLSQEFIQLAPPYRASYSKALATLCERYAAGLVVTGDIWFVDEFHGHFVREICTDLHIDCRFPLWGADRFGLLSEFLRDGFRAVFSCVMRRWFGSSWVGRTLDDSAFGDLRGLVNSRGIDACGERGEYHTIVLDGPIFHTPVQLPPHTVMADESRYYLSITNDADSASEHEGR